MSSEQKNQTNQKHACEHHHHEHEHNHENCSHHHEHKHNHENCSHHHEHKHNHENCSHHHHQETNAVGRYAFSAQTLLQLESETIENLMQMADDYLTQDEFNKVVPIFEIAVAKLSESNLETSAIEAINLKQNLAFSYGIIGEHKNAVSVWKQVISHKEQTEGDCTDLLDDYFGVALSCEQCGMNEEFFNYIQKGLNLAKENKLEEYVASFEHELGGFYCDKQDFSKAELHLKNAIQIRQKLEDVVGLAMSKLSMGIVFEEQKKYDQAKQNYESALALTKNSNYSEELADERKELERRLSQIQNTNLKSKLLNI